MRIAAVVILAASTLTLGAAAPPDVERYEFDDAHTYVGFSVRHMMVTTVKGKFNEFEGELLLDDDDITRSAVRVTIDPASIDTDVERRDNHLRSEDFFDVVRFPKIRFVSKRVLRQGEKLELVGDLTIRDVTREVVLPFELTGPINAGDGRKRIGIEGSLTINRFDYGLRWNRIREAVQVVGDDVKIELNISALTPRQVSEP